MYFDQHMGAPHAVHWSKSFVFAFKQVFLSLSEEKEIEKKGKPHKNMQ